ncbi:hypothetical protein M8J76_010780 [Diaphorina citri]|nr:hypothetical protein M8J76_010780 [Diaphorina citri]
MTYRPRCCKPTGTSSSVAKLAAPDPPTNLSVNVRSGKTAQIFWSPPISGKYSGFKLKVISLSEKTPPRIIGFTENPPAGYSLKDLTPGGSYQVQLFSVYDSKESVAYTSRNFTTSMYHVIES